MKKETQKRIPIVRTGRSGFTGKLWEYQTLGFNHNYPNLIKTLNEKGSKGWELVQIVRSNDLGFDCTAFFKRELR